MVLVLGSTDVESPCVHWVVTYDGEAAISDATKLRLLNVLDGGVEGGATLAAGDDNGDAVASSCFRALLQLGEDTGAESALPNCVFLSSTLVACCDVEELTVRI
jgi:hypothetical protein